MKSLFHRIFIPAGVCLAGYFATLPLDAQSSFGLPKGGLTDVPVTQFDQGNGDGTLEVLQPVGTPPSITSQPHGVNLYVGGSATLTVGVAGDQPLTYQWQKDGTPLPTGTAPIYRISNAQLGDSGGYSLIVTNPYGAVTSGTAVVTVQLPPTCVPIPPGLVSWWRGENNLIDALGKNNGTAPGHLAFAFGKVGQAFQNSFVLVPDDLSLHLTNALTVQAWINPTSFAGTAPNTIVSKITYPQLFFGNTNANDSFFLGLTNNGVPYFTVSPNGSSRTNTVVVSPVPVALNQWTLIVATYDGTALRLYLDGQLAAQTSYSHGIFAGTSHIGIGGVPQSTTNLWPFVGALDEIAIYNRALSDAEILSLNTADSAGMCLVAPTLTAQPQSQAIPLGEDVLFAPQIAGTHPVYYQWMFNGRSIVGATKSSLLLEKVNTNNVGNYAVNFYNGLGSGFSSNATLSLLPRPVCTDLPDGAISWWPADGSLLDVVGTNNLRTLSLSGYPTGKVGRAFIFTNNGDGLQCTNLSALNFGSNADFSIELWAKVLPPTTLLSSNLPPVDFPLMSKQPEVSIGLRGSTGGYSLSLFEGRLAFMMARPVPVPVASASTTFISSGPDLRDGMFHHLAVSVQRAATNGGVLYVDGRPVLTFDPTHWNTSFSNTSPFTIGAPGVSATSNYGYFSGLIDEPTVYGRALSPDEVLAVAQAGASGKCKLPPFITMQPTNQIVVPGGTATFTVGAGGTPTLHYLWRLNGAIISGATRSTLVISNVVTGGTYLAQIANSFGVVTSRSVQLTVDRPPVAVCRDIVVPAGPDCLGNGSVDAGSYDPDGDSITITQTPPGPYPLGTNIVLLTVVDPYGLSNSCGAMVVVADLTPPTVVCPANIVVANDFNQCGAIVTFPPPTATDFCSAVTNLTATPPPGSFFPVGVNVVQCTATDAAGNVGGCSFTVTVRDAQPPVITCPADIVVTNAHDAWTTVVTYNPTVSDNCPGVGSATCNPPSGTAFGIGVHTVACSVQDAAGNSSQCSFTVTVHPGNVPPVPIIDVSPVAMFPGFTNMFVIAPNGSNTTVTFDGSRSYDVDDTNFNYFWYEGTNLFSTNVVAQEVLALGTHVITLWVDDTFPLGTNSTSVTVEVISPALAVEILMGMVADSDLSSRAQRPLLATLKATLGAFERSDITPGINELGAFENKVQAQVAPTEPVLAQQLINAAQAIIGALGG